MPLQAHHSGGIRSGDARRCAHVESKSHVPILDWLPTYHRRWLRADAVAGLSVWALLVPQSLARAGVLDVVGAARVDDTVSAAVAALERRAVTPAYERYCKAERLLRVDGQPRTRARSISAPRVWRPHCIAAPMRVCASASPTPSPNRSESCGSRRPAPARWR
jgi:hypothetical protein